MNPISLTNPWVLVGIGSAALLLTGGGYYTGRVHGADKCSAAELTTFKQTIDDLATNLKTVAGEVAGIRTDVSDRSAAVAKRTNRGVQDARDLTRAGDKSTVSPILMCVLIRQRGFQDPRCGLPDSVSGKTE